METGSFAVSTQNQVKTKNTVKPELLTTYEWWPPAYNEHYLFWGPFLNFYFNITFEQRPPVYNVLYFGVPRAVVAYSFDSIIIIIFLIIA